MATQIEREIGQADATLQSTGMQLAPTPSYADPASGPQALPASPASPAVTGLPDPAKFAAASKPPGPAPLTAGGPPDPMQFEAQSRPQYETTTSRTAGSSGLSAEAQGRANARLDAVGQANRTALDEADEAAAARRDFEVRATEEAVSQAAQRRRDAAAEATINDRVKADVEGRMQAAAEWQPDRSRWFSGSTGAARGILAAVAVIAGGWMQGRGQTSTNQFLPFIMKMIDDDVNDQIRSNSANIQALREKLGDVKAAGAELKKRQLQYFDSELQARAAAAAAKDPSVAQAHEAARAATAAKQAEEDAKARTALERTVTEQINRVTTPVAAGGPAKTNQAAMNLDQNIGELNGVIQDIESVSDDDVQTVVGYGAVKPLGVLPSDNEMKRFLGLMPEGQTRALNAINRYQRIAYMAMTREPNGQLAGVLAKIGVPQNDTEIGEWKRTLKRELANMKSVRQGAAGGVEDPSAGTF